MMTIRALAVLCGGMAALAAGLPAISDVASLSSTETLRSIQGTADCYVDGAGFCPPGETCKMTPCIRQGANSVCPQEQTADYSNDLTFEGEFKNVVRTGDAGWSETVELEEIHCLREFKCFGCSGVGGLGKCLKGKPVAGGEKASRIPTETDQSDESTRCNDPADPQEPPSPSDPTTPPDPSPEEDPPTLSGSFVSADFRDTDADR